MLRASELDFLCVNVEGERRVFGCGRADYGQLGPNYKQEVAHDDSAAQSRQPVDQDGAIGQSRQMWSAVPVEIEGLKQVQQVLQYAHNIKV
jgi:hypothetical protein